MFYFYVCKATSERQVAWRIVEKLLKAIARPDLPSPTETIMNHGSEMWNCRASQRGKVHPF